MMLMMEDCKEDLLVMDMRDDDEILCVRTQARGRASKRVWRGIGLVFLVLSLALVGCSGITVTVNNVPSPTPTNVAPGVARGSTQVLKETHMFQPTDHPTLVIINPVGYVHIKAGNTASVMVTKQSSTNVHDIKVNYSQHGNTMNVTVNIPETNIIQDGSVRIERADIDMTMPSQSDIQVTDTVGEIGVNGIQGALHLRDSTGRIYANQVDLVGDSELTTDVGDVSFKGTVGLRGHYSFRSKTGNVEVALPQNAIFRVNATTQTGQISSEFAAVNVKQDSPVGGSARGDVGASPQAVVTLGTFVGEIHLEKQ